MLWYHYDLAIQSFKSCFLPQIDLWVISSSSQDQRKHKMHSEHKQTAQIHRVSQFSDTAPVLLAV